VEGDRCTISTRVCWTKGMKPEMARLTLAGKIAAITSTLWEKEERFDAE
jgi:hypothetical protein